MAFKKGDLVRHITFGQGTVSFADEDSAAVRFAHGLEECAPTDLAPLAGIQAKIQSGQWDSPLETLCRAQSEAIRSVHAAWGIFARSRIELLPHQLWVCRRVTQTWPARWLVADDVGLGKTIEAGLIAASQISRARVKRLLVLCPANLVWQWQRRLREMFGVKLKPYSTQLDTSTSGFWEDNDAIVASLDTIKLDTARLNRILEAPGFDLLFVDEAHRLGAAPRHSTQAYRLVKSMMESRKVESAVFFSGTPHRGHDYGFLALLQLLRPELFDTKGASGPQWKRLPEVLIRNNKALVTDMEGRPLFQEPVVDSATYTYSPEEARFYERMTEFISSGQLYASRLDDRQGRAVMLVLVSMQKLASSSVAAIRSAIQKRLAQTSSARSSSAELSRLQTLWDEGDESGEAEEEAASSSAGFHLLEELEEEERALRILLADAEAVGRETKISTILQYLQGPFGGRSVLFFTEYKATQRLLLEALFEHFGDDSATFINGDDALSDVTMPGGRLAHLTSDRVEAAADFNAGSVRFLVSTEAGGEGIDLQESCHTLIHVDLPWNPMRLHQRVGRLNRFGQKERVQVLSLRNPDTVESLVWDHLNAKLKRISVALGAAMEQPEDLQQLVLGMAGPTLWNQVFVGASQVKREQFAQWFDAQTATFGGQDALDAVREIVGQASHFDFGKISSALPKVDLPDLQPLLENALALNGRRLLKRGDGFFFHTPQAWRESASWGILMPSEYEGVSFERAGKRHGDDAKKLIGAGHQALEAALEQASSSDASLCLMPSGVKGGPLAILRVRDQVTSGAQTSRDIIFGVEKSAGSPCVLEDWRLLLHLNQWSAHNWTHTQTARAADATYGHTDTAALLNWQETAADSLSKYLEGVEHHFIRPRVEVLSVLWSTLP